MKAQQITNYKEITAQLTYACIHLITVYAINAFLVQAASSTNSLKSNEIIEQ